MKLGTLSARQVFAVMLFLGALAVGYIHTADREVYTARACQR